MDTRKIAYIDQKEDELNQKIAWALSKSYEERFQMYCKILRLNLALAGIDSDHYPSRNKIYYIDEK